MNIFVLSFLLFFAPPLQSEVRTATAPADYVVGPRDVLNIVVFGEPDLSRRYVVESDGTFEFPWVGRVTAGGLTHRSIERELIKRLTQGFLLAPQVSVEVAEYHSQIIFITGEVRTSGTYPLRGGLTVLRALALAGSSVTGASSEIVILRPRAPQAHSGPAIVGDETVAETIRVSVKDLQNGARDVDLRDRDTIFVPKAETFFVTGQVRSPGSYVLERGMTVLQAISLAGGLSERGSDKGVKILRTLGGKQLEVGVSLSDVVEAGDTIVVRQRYF